MAFQELRSATRVLVSPACGPEPSPARQPGCRGSSRKSRNAEPKKGAQINTSKTESSGSAKQEDRAAGNNRKRDAAPVVAPPRPAQTSARTETGCTDIGAPVTVGLIPKEASTDAGRKTEHLVEKGFECPSRGIAVEIKNEPTLAVVARVETPLTPGPEAHGRTAETPDPAPSAGPDTLTTEPRAEPEPAIRPGPAGRAAVTTEIQAQTETTVRPSPGAPISGNPSLWVRSLKRPQRAPASRRRLLCKSGLSAPRGGSRPSSKTNRLSRFSPRSRPL